MFIDIFDIKEIKLHDVEKLEDDCGYTMRFEIETKKDSHKIVLYSDHVNDLMIKQEGSNAKRKTSKKRNSKKG